MKRQLFLLSSFAAAASVLSGCKDSTPANTNEIVIGEIAAKNGGNATFGISSHAGTQMAIDEVNAAGGLLGKQIKLESEDDQSKQGEPGTLAKKLVSLKKVHAMLGEVASRASLEMAPVCQKAGVPMISPASTNDAVTKEGDYIFRVCFTDSFQGTVMSKFALSKGWKKVAVLVDTKQDYSTGLSGFFKTHFTANGGTVTGESAYQSGDKDFKAQLTALKAGNPDAILASGYYGETALIAKQARELGITAPLLGGDGWDSPSLVEVAGSAIEGCFFSNHFSTEDQSPKIQEFVKKYKAKHGTVPDAMAALGYDSAMVLCEAIKRAGTTDGAKLRDAIAATKDHDGVTGKITLDAGRNANKPAVVLTIKDGKYSYVTTIAP